MGVMEFRQTQHVRTIDTFTLRGFPLVEFKRKAIDLDQLRGFVVGSSSELTLVHCLNEHSFQLNGYVAIRNRDISEQRPILEDEFLARVARLQRLKPRRPDSVALTSMRTAAESSGAAFPLITIHREQIKRGACFIGRTVSVTQRSVVIRSISPQAEWEGLDRYQLRDITLLEFGGIYESLLLRVAGVG